MDEKFCVVTHEDDDAHPYGVEHEDRFHFREDAERYAKAVGGDVEPWPRFYATIATITTERPATAEDFVPFVGCTNWALIDGFEPDEALGKTERIVEVKIRRIFAEKNAVEVLAKIHDSVPDGTLMHFDADELAIRIEAT